MGDHTQFIFWMHLLLLLLLRRLEINLTEIDLGICSVCTISLGIIKCRLVGANANSSFYFPHFDEALSVSPCNLYVYTLVSLSARAHIGGIYLISGTNSFI